jgi:hypothetical protein
LIVSSAAAGSANDAATSAETPASRRLRVSMKSPSRKR